MSREITSPLQNIIGRAARVLPAHTGQVATQQARIERRSGATVILADISASMNGPAWGAQRKIDVLRDAVAGARQQRSAALYVFSSEVRRSDVVPEPESSTDLAAALREMTRINTGTTLLISDGRPDNESAALEAARAHRGAIDVLYIGPESDTHAIDFMRRLAAEAQGEVRTHDLTRIGHSSTLQMQIAGLLA